jgi:hypothetical protein
VSLDRVCCEDIDAKGPAYAKAAGPVLHAWKATAQAYADGLPEILATAVQGDFGEVESPLKVMERDVLRGLRAAGISEADGKIWNVLRHVMFSIFPPDSELRAQAAEEFKSRKEESGG